MKGAVTQTVGEYSRNNQLEKRIKEWEWFKDLVSKFGKNKYDNKLLKCDPSGQSTNIFLNLIHSLWYDFDAIPLNVGKYATTLGSLLEAQYESQRQGSKEEKEQQREREWENIKRYIEEKTISVCKELEECCDFNLRGEEFEQGFQLFAERMIQQGFLEEDALDNVDNDDEEEEEEEEDSWDMGSDESENDEADDDEAESSEDEELIYEELNDDHVHKK